MDRLLAFALDENTLDRPLSSPRLHSGLRIVPDQSLKREKKFERKDYTPDYDFKPKLNPKSRLIVSRSRSRPKLFEQQGEILEAKNTKSTRFLTRGEADRFYDKREITRGRAPEKS